MYLFAGAEAPPDDADGDAADGSDPVVFQPLAFDGLNAVVPYQIAFVEAGDYTVAATCHFDVDASPESSEYDPGAASGERGLRDHGVDDEWPGHRRARCDYDGEPAVGVADAEASMASAGTGMTAVMTRPAVQANTSVPPLRAICGNPFASFRPQARR